MAYYDPTTGRYEEGTAPKQVDSQFAYNPNMIGYDQAIANQQGTNQIDPFAVFNAANPDQPFEGPLAPNDPRNPQYDPSQAGLDGNNAPISSSGSGYRSYARNYNDPYRSMVGSNNNIPSLWGGYSGQGGSSQSQEYLSRFGDGNRDATSVSGIQAQYTPEALEALRARYAAGERFAPGSQEDMQLTIWPTHAQWGRESGSNATRSGEKQSGDGMGDGPAMPPPPDMAEPVESAPVEAMPPPPVEAMPPPLDEYSPFPSTTPSPETVQTSTGGALPPPPGSSLPVPPAPPSKALNTAASMPPPPPQPSPIAAAGGQGGEQHTLDININSEQGSNMGGMQPASPWTDQIAYSQQKYGQMPRPPKQGQYGNMRRRNNRGRNYGI